MQEFSGVVRIENDAGRPAIVLDGQHASVRVGVRYPGPEGPLAGAPTTTAAIADEGPSFVVYRIALDGATGAITLSTDEGVPLATLGGADSGDLTLRDASGRATLELHGAAGELQLGAEEQAGRVAVRDRRGREVVQLGGRAAELRLGSLDHDGSLVVVDGSTGFEALRFDAGDGRLLLGTTGTGASVLLRDENGDETILLDGPSGDIVLSNADAAEEFTLADAAVAAPPGAVMVLTDDGAVRPCTDAYDPRLVGVVAGAGAHRPAIVLDRRPRSRRRRVPISVLGKVSCRADAGHAPIGVGDLLTSSPSPGCAMRVADRSRALGALLGKALTPLAAGESLVDVLVGLR